jgi:hypothetical protein
MEEILQRDNIAASEPVPVEIAERLASNRIVLSSNDRGFDPRKYFTKIKGSNGAWELSTKEPVIDGLRVGKMERVKPGSLRRAARGARIIEAFRPSWQPYIYHPKTMVVNSETRMLKRKSGAKVRPHVVFNRDDRETFLPVGYPWHCVGRVFKNFGNGWQGGATATLVGSRTVLCSAHMIPWGQPGVGIMFIPGYFSSQSISSTLLAANGRATSSFVTAVQGYIYEGRQAWDIAVMRLADPLGDWLGTFGTRTYNDDWEDDPRWTLVGYPTEWGYRTITAPFFPPFTTTITTNGDLPTRQFGISVEDDVADAGALELEHHGDSSPGNSGGPLFGHWPNGPYVIGVESGEEVPDEVNFYLGARTTNIAAGGNPMVDLVKWARETWV